MGNGEGSVVRDPGLAPLGRAKISWARRRMPVLAAVGSELQASGVLRGRRVGLALHVEAKTACLALTLREAGAEVAVAGCNPLSTQDEVAAALAEAGVTVFAVRGATEEEYFHYLRLVCRTGPDLVVDDGGDLTALLHTEEKGGRRRPPPGCGGLRPWSGRGCWPSR